MNLTILGTGPAGLATAVAFAHAGHGVACVDLAAAGRTGPKSGVIPVLPADAGDEVARLVGSGGLRWSEDIAGALLDAEVILLLTPSYRQPDGSADLEALRALARELGKHLAHPVVLADATFATRRSVEVLDATLAECLPAGIGCDVVSCPSLVPDDGAVGALPRLERVVVGVSSPRPVARLEALFEPFDIPLLVTDLATAELIRPIAGAFLALETSFVNALARICEANGADVVDVRHALRLDPRIGRAIPKAGLGFRGTALARDLATLVELAHPCGGPVHLLREVQAIDDRQVESFLQRVAVALPELRGARLAVLGLAETASTPGFEASPIAELCRRLLQDGAALRLHDPSYLEQARAAFGAEDAVQVIPDAVDAAEGCAALIVGRAAPEYARLDLGELRRRLSRPLVFDACNLLDRDEMKRLGFEYHGVGR